MNSTRHILLLTALLAAPAVAAQSDEIILITRNERIEQARLVEIAGRAVRIRDHAGSYRSFSLAELTGFVNPNAEIETFRGLGSGMMVLTDGERYPGRIEREPTAGSDIIWTHHWLGDLAIEFDRIAWVRFDASAEAPAPGDADVVVMANGDRVEGFIESVAGSVRLEREDSVLDIPLDHVSAIRLVNATAAPEAGVCRVWLTDGTVVDADSVSFSDDGFLRFTAPISIDGGESAFPLSKVAGLLFDPRAMTALASIEPHDVEGPATRYILPEPQIASEEAALGLRPIEISGPITIRYRLPRAAERFVARAEIPAASGAWADFELVISDDDREVFRATLNQSRPAIPIDIRVRGSELTIQISEGANGPIQDRVILQHAMLLLRGE